MLEQFKEKNVVGYGYGSTFHLVNEMGIIQWTYVVDKDPQKWGTKDGYIVVGVEYIKEINLEDFVFLIFPYESQGIIEFFLSLGVPKSSIYTLKDLLKDAEFNEEFNNKQQQEKDKNRINRELRSRVINIDSDHQAVFRRWFNNNINLKYRDINLKFVLAASISTLLEYACEPSLDITLPFQPAESKYVVYGDGPILVPMFASIRADHHKRMAAILKEIDKELISIITFDDININNYDLKRIEHFKYSINEKNTSLISSVIDTFEETYFQLTLNEKEWLKHTSDYFIQLIDFYLDVIDYNFDFRVLLSIFPYYLQENILYQISVQKNAKNIVYQHGNYIALNPELGFHMYLYTYAMESDYYLLWNEKSKKELFETHNKQLNKLIVLGNPCKIEVFKNKKTNKFLVILPGKVEMHEQKIQVLVEHAEKLAAELNLKYDVRFHPLNYIALNKEGLHFFGKEVNISSCNFDDYDFYIGRESALLDELEDSGLMVYRHMELIRDIPSYYQSINQLLDLVRVELLSEDDNNSVQLSLKEIQQKYASFILKVLDE
ncbi:hypothetical protein ABFY60_02885 [Lysinibacillus pakistanensis]|uniref:hypothetical protein n=1 Tax=Lysinibacillus pakistanensis TaxID=759811 RepID=UPI003D26C4CA